jgi:hypothetical protein
MSLSSKFNKLTIEPHGESADSDMEAAETQAPSQNAPAQAPANIQTGMINNSKTRGEPKQPKEDVFTFVTVYYKHGGWGTSVYDTLREGLLDFVNRCASPAQRETLISLDDEDLLDRMLIIGTDRVPLTYINCC